MLDAIAKSRWVSASQQSTYELCPKKWGFNKLDGIPRPPNRFAERGLAVHKVLENWVEKGMPIDPGTEAGKIAMPGLKYLPLPGTGLTEHSFTFESDVATYTGLWDLLIPTPRLYVGRTPIIEVYDYKTTTDFKWMKTFNGLRQDPQAVLYAVSALFSLFERWKFYCPENPGICLTWIYFRANASKPGARRVQMYVLPDEEEALPVRPEGLDDEHFGVIRVSELEQRYHKIEAVSAEMLEHHRQGRKGVDLPANIQGCRAYGGCPYQGDPCVLTTKDMLRGIMAQENAADKIRAKAQQGGQAASGGMATAAPPQQTEMTIAQKIAQRAQSATVDASPEAVAAAQAEVLAAAAGAADPAGRGEPAVNPPEAETAAAQVQATAQPAQPAQAQQPAQPAQAQPAQAQPARERTPQSVESFTVTALGLAERVHYASLIAAGLVQGAPSLDSIREETVARKALDIVDAIVVEAVR